MELRVPPGRKRREGTEGDVLAAANDRVGLRERAKLRPEGNRARECTGKALGTFAGCHESTEGRALFVLPRKDGPENSTP